METSSSHANNVYWFLRYLVQSRFGNYASKETESLDDLIDLIDRKLSEIDQDCDEEEIESAFKDIEDYITDSVNKMWRGEISKKYRQTEDMLERIERRLNDHSSLLDLRIAVEAVKSTTQIQESNDSFGNDEIHEIIDQTLESEKGSLKPENAYEALFNVDVEGEEFQLSIQRKGLSNYAENLEENLIENNDIDEADAIAIISAIAQEYERRAGQSRASTAGNVLETGLKRIFSRFGIPNTGSPEHFGDLELDNIVEGPDGSVGFSCKRSLRERFRQSLQRQSEVGVDEIWFVSLMMADITEEKIRDIQNDGGRVYVPRDSFIWRRYGEKEDLEGLRPADRFLHDLCNFTGHELEMKITG
ncbi:MAG: hypothetical protein ABEJ83_01655 [Candidatus Nanohaloarchaea archaeon]